MLSSYELFNDAAQAAAYRAAVREAITAPKGSAAQLAACVKATEFLKTRHTSYPKKDTNQFISFASKCIPLEEEPLDAATMVFGFEYHDEELRLFDFRRMMCSSIAKTSDPNCFHTAAVELIEIQEKINELRRSYDYRLKTFHEQKAAKEGRTTLSTREESTSIMKQHEGHSALYECIATLSGLYLFRALTVLALDVALPRSIQTVRSELEKAELDLEKYQNTHVKYGEKMDAADWLGAAGGDDYDAFWTNASNSYQVNKLRTIILPALRHELALAEAQAKETIEAQAKETPEAQNKEASFEGATATK